MFICGKNTKQIKKTPMVVPMPNPVLPTSVLPNRTLAISPTNREKIRYTNIFYKFCASGIISPSAVNNKDYNKN